MKKLILSAFLALLCASVYAGNYNIKVSPDIPADASALLVQRFTQMLADGGHTVSADGILLEVTGEVTDRMETPGSMSQVALSVVVKASCGGVVAEFPLTGVGADDADAWFRAVKRLLPRSKEAQGFISGLN